jgi:formylglycine-generating enzyme required for sulfatase activity
MPQCPTGLGGPPLVAIPKHGGGGIFCIDQTEVTAAQYAAWLKTNPAPASGNAVCAWNTDYTPSTTENQCGQVAYDPVARPDMPVTCVDWCDARDYCLAMGKRLCHAQNGQPDDYALGYADATQSEWMMACTADGFRLYPYGDTYDAGLCNDDAHDGAPGNGPLAAAQPVSVGAASGCKGGYPELLDMSGNVWEWTDACQSSANPSGDLCRDRGGSFWDSGPSLLDCASTGWAGHTRGYRNKNIGFRCCADAVP